VSVQTQSDYAKLRHTPRQKLSDIVPLPVPFTIYIEPTNVCNFSCSYCPHSFDDYRERAGGLSSLTVESCAKVLDEIATMGRLRTLNFYMLGEPYANRSLPAFIAMAKERDVADRIIVTTNGTLLNEQMANETIASGLDFLRISIYGSTAERQREVTRSKIPLDRIIANIRQLRLMREAMGVFKPYIYCKMIDSGDAAENANFLKIFAPLSDEIEIEAAMNWNLDEDEHSLSGLNSALQKTTHLLQAKSACPFPFYTLVINADLRVSVCCVDWEKATTIGNLATQSLKDIWNGEALRDFQLTHLAGERHTIEACRNCSYLHTAPDWIDDLSPAAYRARIAD
jgi:radical SAM protein with 4Fe4S-binding SPASM domain